MTWKLGFSADLGRASYTRVRTWGCLPISVQDVLSTHRRRVSRALCRGAVRAVSGQPPWPQLMLRARALQQLPWSHQRAARSSPGSRDIPVHREAAHLTVCPRLAQRKTLAGCVMVLRSSAFLQRAVRIPHTSICVGTVSAWKLCRRTRRRGTASTHTSLFLELQLGEPLGSSQGTVTILCSEREENLLCHRLLLPRVSEQGFGHLIAARFARRAVPGFDCYQNKEKMPNLTASPGQHRGTQ